MALIKSANFTKRSLEMTPSLFARLQTLVEPGFLLAWAMYCEQLAISRVLPFCVKNAIDIMLPQKK